MDTLLKRSLAILLGSALYSCAPRPVLEGETSSFAAGGATAGHVSGLALQIVSGPPRALDVATATLYVGVAPSTVAEFAPEAAAGFCVGSVAECQMGSQQTVMLALSRVTGDGTRVYGPTDAIGLREGMEIQLHYGLATGERKQRAVRIVAGQPGGGTTPTPIPTPMPPMIPPPPRPESEPCYKAEPEICQIELEIVRLTNIYRAQSSRPAQTHAPKISYVSRIWSAAQGRRGSIGHEGFPSQRQRDYIAEFGSMGTARLSAENVAMFGGFSSDPNAVAKRFTDMWWNSPGHRRNMLGNFSAIGVGVSRDARGTWYATQIFGSP